jgi:hypothetical protein
MPSDLVVASAGAVAAAASTVIMYPVDTVKTRLSLGVDSSSKPYRNVVDVVNRTWKSGGMSAFYRGMEKKIWISILQKFLYFYFFNLFKRKLSSSRISVSTHLLLGYLAAVISSIFVTPLEIVQTRLQLKDDKSLISDTSLLSILGHDGFSGLYRGFSTNLLLCSNPAIEYTVFDKLRRKFQSTFLLGVVSKTVATVLTYPFIRAKTLQQATGDKRPLGLMVSNMILYKGLDAQLSKVVLTSALMLVIKERVEDRIVAAFK